MKKKELEIAFFSYNKSGVYLSIPAQLPGRYGAYAIMLHAEIFARLAKNHVREKNMEIDIPGLFCVCMKKLENW